MEARLDISVVIPTFRRPAPLLEAIRSVLAQEQVELEVLVIDDSPEGSAREIVESIRDDRMTYRKRAVPSGGNPSLVRNEGWPVARGKFVHFLDDDDRVPPGVYRDVVAAFAAHPDRGVVFGQIAPFGEDLDVLAHERRTFAIAARRARLFDRLGSRFAVVANQLYATPTLLVNSACVIRREHVASLGGYDEGIRVMEDVEFYVRAIRAFGFAYLDRVVVEYRTGAPSIMHDLKYETRRRPVHDAYRRMYSKHRARYGTAELFALKAAGKAIVRWL